MGILMGILSLALFVACQSPSKNEKPTEAGASPDANLTMDEAHGRSSLSDISYALRLKLDEKTTEFSGTEEIKFTLPKSKDVFVDFKYGKVTELKINGTPSSIHYDGFRLYLPSDALREGANQVNISFTQTYSKNGAGLYRFVDPEDKSVYLYTQFEPFDAHQMFPCFDQPDLKAVFQLTVEAPANWVVVTATRETSNKTTGDMKAWVFPTTPKISTYLVSLIAGPYKIWISQYKDIPLRLMARKSLSAQVNTEEWFAPLKYGLQFYGDNFAYAYPFKKYDQLIVPDFNAGAMENIAAVTFSERFLRSGKKTKKETDRLASVILHELAHMWFGDLVTMKWWNGLWLNESFATYISNYAMSKNKLYPDTWIGFAIGDKNWAYTEDQYVTTHPIELVVPDTLTAGTNFDGITYGKGASVLKQLHFFVGEDKFREGLRAYFKTHQYSNTELGDFLGALAKESGADLTTWSDLWLEEAGLDSVKVEFTCQRDRYKTFDLVQTPAPESKQYRPHRTIVGLFDERNGKMVLRKKVEVGYQGPRTSVVGMIGQDCAEIVYPNVDDHDYVKVELDGNSTQALASKISKVDDTLTRAILWLNLYQMVRDQKLKLGVYAKMATEALRTEDQVRVIDRILESLLGYGKSGYQSVRDYWPRGSDTEKKTRLLWVGELESVLWLRASRAAPGSDLQKLWFDAYVKSIETPAGAKRLVGILKDQTKLTGFILDQDRRWDLIVKLSQVGSPDAIQFVEAEAKIDKSEKGQKQALAARAVLPKQEQKIHWFNEIIVNKEMSLARIKSVLESLNPYSEKEFKTYLNAEFYTRLPSVMKERDQEFLGEFVEKLVPRGCNSQSTKVLGDFIKQQGKGLSPVVSRPLRVTLQEEERCLNIRAFSAR